MNKNKSMSKNKLHNLSCKQAAQMLEDDSRAILIDIRSTMEFLFVGHPQGAVHLPWIDEPDWTVDPNFTTEVRKLMLGGTVCDIDEGCAPVILICRSGKRSKEAGIKLLNDGLKNVFHIDEGFEGERDENGHRGALGGWRYHKLPWEQC